MDALYDQTPAGAGILERHHGAGADADGRTDQEPVTGLEPRQHAVTRHLDPPERRLAAPSATMARSVHPATSSHRRRGVWRGSGAFRVG